MKKISSLKRFCILLTVLMLAFSSGAAFADDMIKIGVLALRGPEKAMSQWLPTAEYLSEKIGKQVRIQPLKFTEVPIFLKGKKVDFFLVNSSMFADMKNQFGGEAIASLINSRQGKALNQFGGVIFVKADSPIQSLADIKGKTFMAVKKSSFGGYQMAQRLLLQNGIDPEKDTKLFKEGGTHDMVVDMVSKGVIEVGTVRSDTLERMTAEGKADMTKLRILNAQKDDFPFVRSTELYPEWPMAATADTDPALVAQVKEALLAMPSDSPAAKAAKIVGWSAPLDYKVVEDCMKELKFGSFK